MVLPVYDAPPTDGVCDGRDFHRGAFLVCMVAMVTTPIYAISAVM